jgi:hypothetical protein
MGDLSFDVELTWSGAGHEGAGRIQTDDVALDLSGPESMGGRGVGTNPEKLLVCAVSSCYTGDAVRRAVPGAASDRVADCHRARHRDGLPGCHAVHPDRCHPDGSGATSPVSPGTRPLPLWRTIAASSAIRSPPRSAQCTCKETFAGASHRRLAARQTASGVPTRIVDAVRRLDEQDQFGIDELMRLLATPPTSDERSDR